ncbi:MAG TPA: rod shape-determining protein MreD [Burkholderiales bacterium]|nr:rod shape-determining protein MreD [Burkholderiales bacterium]
MAPERPHHILLPVRTGTIVASFAAALLLNFLPWPNLALAPDFVALALAFWCVRQPRLVGLASAWGLGLLVDAGNGVLLGQHALAYSALAFFAIALSRRILWFDAWGQMLHVLLMLEGAQLVALGVRLATGAEFPGWPLFLGPLAATLLWPAVTWLLLIPQRRPMAADANRPL